MKGKKKERRLMNKLRTCLKNIISFHSALQYSIYLLIIILSSSCSVTRKIPANDKLYTGAKVKIQDKETPAKQKKALEKELHGLVRPKPNTKLLGIPYKLMFYNMVDTVPRKRGLKHFIKNKLGEPPVLFSQVSVEANNKILSNRLQNRGFFHARSSAEVIEKEKKVRVVYKPEPGPQYFIRDVKFLIDSTHNLGEAVMNTKPETFLKSDDAYDLDVIKAERDRIDARLKEKGFYYFSSDDILVQADSTVGEYKVDLFVRLKSTTPLKARNIYHINNTYIFPDFNIADDTSSIRQAEKYGDFYIIDPLNKWKPKTFSRFIFFQKGDVYNRTDHNIAINRMISIGAFKFVKNRFVETGDSSKLDVYYYLTPFPKKSIRAEVTGKKTDADFTGTEINLNWRNRSMFRGAELVTVSAYGGSDFQAGGNDSLSNRNYFKLGSQITLSVPRFITPFNIQGKGAFIPKTRFSIGYDYLRRQNSYLLNSFRSIAGYTWKENVRKEHVLNVLEINYVHPANVTPLYRQLAESDATLRKAIENQFTIGSTYRYTYTNTAETNKIHTFYYHHLADLSGNIIGLLSGADIKNGEQKMLFGAPFSQYVKLENDLRYYLKLGEDAKWANRIFAGMGYAYGNSTNLPFLKQFFIGGSNSIRAFRARTIGPGTYYAPDDPNTRSGFTADQSGDIKLEMNTEYRSKIAGILHGALFVDAGNIWLLNDDIDPEARKEGSLFSKDFINDLIVGGGVGLRLDFSFVLLRFDLAFPWRKPWLPPGERWVFNEIKFGDPRWRKENLVLNLAIGYPF